MSNQNKKSFKQVIKSEYKIITFFTVVLLLLPIITQSILLIELIKFNSMSGLAKFAAFLGLTEFNLINTDILSFISIIVILIMALVLPLIMARKLNGQRLLHSIRDGFKDLGNIRAWKYIGFIYLPYVLIVSICVIIIGFIPDDVIVSLVTNVLTSVGVATVVILLLIVISVIFTTITGILVVANVVYMRGEFGIVAAFSAIKNREVNKILIFNLTQSLVGILVTVGFIVFAFKLKPLTLVTSIFTIIIVYLIFFIIYQIVFVYFRFSLYMNVASKTDFVNNEDKAKKVKAKKVKANKQLETAPEVVAEETEIVVEETEVVAEETEVVANETPAPKLTIKPKRTSRQLNVEEPKKVHAKRTVK